MRALLILLLCVGVAGCGVKPKRLDAPSGYPAGYPQE